jgi:hypothetical protein
MTLSRICYWNKVKNFIIAVDHFPLPNMKIHIKWHNKYDQPKIYKTFYITMTFKSIFFLAANHLETPDFAI